jgi:hypothetical protein
MGEIRKLVEEEGIFAARSEQMVQLLLALVLWEGAYYMYIVCMNLISRDSGT